MNLFPESKNLQNLRVLGDVLGRINQAKEKADTRKKRNDKRLNKLRKSILILGLNHNACDDSDTAYGLLVNLPSGCLT